MIKKILIISILAATPIAAFAVEGTNPQPGDLRPQNNSSTQERAQVLKQQREQKEKELKEKADAKKEEVRKKRCEKAEGVLAQRSAKVGEKKANIDQHLNTVEQRWQKLIDRANTKEVDSTQLQQALVQFKEYHATFVSDLDTLRQLQTSTPKACGEDSEASNLKSEIRAAHTKVLQDAKQIRTFRQDTQKNVVVPLLKEMAKTKQSETESEGAKQ